MLDARMIDLERPSVTQLVRCGQGHALSAIQTFMMAVPQTAYWSAYDLVFLGLTDDVYAEELVVITKCLH